MINWHSQGSIYGAAAMIHFLDTDEGKEIFNNGMIAHSQGTIIYASKLRDDLETEEGRWNFNS